MFGERGRIKCEGHQIFDQKLKTFLFFSCLMGDVLFVWTAAYQTCLMWACVPRLLSGLYQLFDQCLIKHVLILATHFNISIVGHQTMFDGVWSPNISRLSRTVTVLSDARCEEKGNYRVLSVGELSFDCHWPYNKMD